VTRSADPAAGHRSDKTRTGRRGSADARASNRLGVSVEDEIARVGPGCTRILFLVPGIELREWAAEVVFVAAHLAAAEVLVSGHRRE
jgi:hypothetical protein